LNSISFTNIYINEIVDFGKNTKTIKINCCNIQKLPDVLPSNLETLDMNKILIHKITDENYFNIDTLCNIYLNKINVDKIVLPNLIKLAIIKNCPLIDLKYNELNSNLEHLEIINCGLKQIDTPFPRNLKYLNLAHNKLKRVPIISNKISYCNLNFNSLTTVEFDSNPGISTSRQKVDISRVFYYKKL